MTNKTLTHSEAFKIVQERLNEISDLSVWCKKKGYVYSTLIRIKNNKPMGSHSKTIGLLLQEFGYTVISKNVEFSYTIAIGD
jgi:hypothetical protein